MDMELLHRGKVVFAKIINMIIVLALLCFGGLQLSAQDSILNDSLLHRFENDTTFSPKERLDLALRFSILFERTNPAKADSYTLSAIEIAHKMQDTIQLFDLKLRLAWSYNYQCNYMMAEKQYLDAFKIISSNGSTSQIAKVNYFIADNYYDWSNYTLAESYYERAIDYYKKIDDTSGIAKSLIGISSIASNSGDYGKAIGYMKKARDFYLEIGDRNSMAGTYLGLGVIMENWGKYEEALVYFNKAIDIFREENDTFQEINLLLHIGDIKLKNEFYSEALVHYNQALNLEELNPNIKLRSICYSNIGEAYFEMEEYETALRFQEKALALKYEVGDKKRIAISLLSIGKINFAVGNNNLSEKNIREALKLAHEIDLKSVEMESLYLLADINHSKGNHKESFDYLKQYLEVKDVIFDIESQEMLNDMAVKYEAERIEKENEILRKNETLNSLELDRQRDSMFYALIIIIVIVISSTLFTVFFQIKSNQQKRNYSILAKKNKEITEQKESLSKLNRELVYSQEKYRSIVENATIGMFQTLPDGSIKYANSGLVKMLGYNTLDELKKVDLDNEQPSRVAFIKLLEEHRIISGREDVWRRRDGSSMHVNESAWVVRDYEGNILHYEGIVEDITLRKVAEIALNESQEKLTSINKKLIDSNREFEAAKNEAIAANEIKSQFIANISHEIRTPMNSIIGFTELLAKLNTDQKQLSYIDAIKTSSNNLLNLINDVLDLSKIQANEIEVNYSPMSFKEIVQDIEKVFSLRFSEKGIYFKISIDKNLPDKIFMDMIRIRQVLYNLVANALKFTEEGSITLCVNCDKYTDYVDLRITISDTGVGIHDSDFETIFDAFKQGRSQSDIYTEGTGLGLNISKKLIEALGGSITLKSRVGDGSEFIISLPNVEIASNKTESSRKSTLVSDDDFFNKVPESPVVSPEILADLSPEIQNEIASIYSEEWNEIANSTVINEIVGFTKIILEFAKKRKNSTLIEFCSTLLFYTENFDIENLNKFKAVLNKIMNNDSFNLKK